MRAVAARAGSLQLQRVCHATVATCLHSAFAAQASGTNCCSRMWLALVSKVDCACTYARLTAVAVQCCASSAQHVNSGNLYHSSRRAAPCTNYLAAALQANPTGSKIYYAALCSA